MSRTGTTNITIALPDEVAKVARHLAVDEGLSLSGYVAELISERVRHAGTYEAARDRQLRLLQAGFDLGTNGPANWIRDELHER
jgi:hypothetical protein